MLQGHERGSFQCIHLHKTVPQLQPSSKTNAGGVANCLITHIQGGSDSGNITLIKTLKRTRAEGDIDGHDQAGTYRKKRRLSLDLVTSRLSRPYATPATHIIGTRAWRAGAWARQRFVGGKLLRKAAILNFIAMTRRKDLPNPRGINRHDARSTTPFVADAPTPGIPQTAVNSISRRRHCEETQLASVPLPPEYEAFDYDFDESNDEEESDGDCDESGDDFAEPIHSDFSLLDSSDTEPEFFDTSWSFATLPNTYEPDPRTGGKEIGLVMENESSREISLAPVLRHNFHALPREPLMVGV